MPCARSSRLSVSTTTVLRAMLPPGPIIREGAVSVPLDNSCGDGCHRVRPGHAEALHIPDAERLDAQQDVLLLDALRDHAHAGGLAHPHHGLQLVARRLAGEAFPGARAVGL